MTILPDDAQPEVRDLAQAYISNKVIPKHKIEDALHVAYATYHEMDVLLSWNFKHLANLNKEEKILAVNINKGYRLPLRLLSPLEVSYEK